MKRDFTVRHGALDGAEAFLSVAQHRSRAAAELGVTPSEYARKLAAELFFCRCQLGNLREYFVKLGRKPLECILAFVGVRRKHGRRSLVR